MLRYAVPRCALCTVRSCLLCRAVGLPACNAAHPTHMATWSCLPCPCRLYKPCGRVCCMCAGDGPCLLRPVRQEPARLLPGWGCCSMLLQTGVFRLHSMPHLGRPVAWLRYALPHLQQSSTSFSATCCCPTELSSRCGAGQAEEGGRHALHSSCLAAPRLGSLPPQPCSGRQQQPHRQCQLDGDCKPCLPPATGRCSLPLPCCRWSTLSSGLPSWAATWTC